MNGDTLKEARALAEVAKRRTAREAWVRGFIERLGSTVPSGEGPGAFAWVLDELRELAAALEDPGALEADLELLQGWQEAEGG